MNSRYKISYEPFYYGKRLKAYIKVIRDKQEQNDMYIAQLFTHNKEKIGQKVFFKVGANYREQTELYTKCCDYVLDYLNNKCIY